MNFEFTLSKKDTPLIEKEGEFEMIVVIIGYANYYTSTGYVNKFGDKEEPDENSYSVVVDEVCIFNEDLNILCVESGCNDQKAMHEYISSIDFAEFEKVREYFISLEV
jgi:hypothetical protein